MIIDLPQCRGAHSSKDPPLLHSVVPKSEKCSALETGQWFHAFYLDGCPQLVFGYPID